MRPNIEDDVRGSERVGQFVLVADDNVLKNRAVHGVGAKVEQTRDLHLQAHGRHLAMRPLEDRIQTQGFPGGPAQPCDKKSERAGTQAGMRHKGVEGFIAKSEGVDLETMSVREIHRLVFLFVAVKEGSLVPAQSLRGSRGFYRFDGSYRLRKKAGLCRRGRPSCHPSAKPV